MLLPGLVLDGVVVFLEAKGPSCQARGHATRHRLLHRVQPTQGTVVCYDTEVSAPQVWPEVLACFDNAQQLTLGDGVVSLWLRESTTIEGNWSLLTIVVELL